MREVKASYVEQVKARCFVTKSAAGIPTADSVDVVSQQTVNEVDDSSVNDNMLEAARQDNAQQRYRNPD